MSRFFDALKRLDAKRCFVFTDRESGLEAFLVIDDLTLGPAAGGIRTRRYASTGDAVEEVAALARAMTLKCALAGLDAGGGKVVVLEHSNLDRPAAFTALGRRIQELGGLFRTAGDLGTTAADIGAMAEHCEWVHDFTPAIAESVARGTRACMEVCAEVHGDQPLGESTVAIQGCGFIGAALARNLAATGATLVLADSDAAVANELAQELDAETLDAGDILAAKADILAPCAVGGVITDDNASEIQAWAVCGAANNILASAAAGRVLDDHGVLFVPDPISSAGGVIDGIGSSVMGLDDRTPLFDALTVTTREVLAEAAESKRTTTEIAVERARARIAEASA